MPTNNEIWEKINADWYTIDTSDCGAEDEFDTDECDDEHRCFKHAKELMDDVASRFQVAATSKHIGAIWNWWATKPQKSKNDATTRIITRADIEELVRMIK